MTGRRIRIKHIYSVFLESFLMFYFCDSHLEVSVISMNMYHLELKPASYKLIMVCILCSVNFLCYCELMFNVLTLTVTCHIDYLNCLRGQINKLTRCLMLENRVAREVAFRYSLVPTPIFFYTILI